jgi:hypothetical protein
MIKTKLILACSALAFVLAPQLATAVSSRITSYAGLLDALNNGHRVMAIADNTKCVIKEYDNPGHKSDDMPDPDLEMMMGINFTSHFFLKYRDLGDKRYHVLAVANNMGSLADHTPIQRLKQIKIYDDNTASVYAAAANYQNGKVLVHIISSCVISNGRDKNGLSIFDYDVVG